MLSEVLVSHFEGRLWTAVRENECTAELRVERETDGARVGDIVKGRVSGVLPGMQSAFLDIGAERGAFLHARDLFLSNDPVPPPPIQDRLREGRELLVQVAREGRGAKGARVTGHVVLPGRLLVLLAESTRRAVSRRIESRAERKRLQGILEGLPGETNGWIARSVAAGAEARRVENEARRLLRHWSEVRERASAVAAPGTVLAGPDILHETLRDAPSNLTRIRFDDPVQRQRALDYLGEVDPVMASKLRLEPGPPGLFERYGVGQDIDRALRPRVWLKSGGYLVIQETEALVSIDVNTGKYLGKKDVEQTILRTNLEAAGEIPRQLRLRGLGGIVVVDLIDMRDARSREDVLARIREGLARDPVRTRVVGLGQLGLLQLTRKRTRIGLADELTRPCPACRGVGRVRHSG